MTPLEAVGRAVCDELAAHPETWRGFEPAIRKALDAFLSALPPELADAVREHMEPPK